MHFLRLLLRLELIQVKWKSTPLYLREEKTLILIRSRKRSRERKGAVY